MSGPMGWTYSCVSGWQSMFIRFSLECMTRGKITRLCVFCALSYIRYGHVAFRWGCTNLYQHSSWELLFFHMLINIWNCQTFYWSWKLSHWCLIFIFLFTIENTYFFVCVLDILFSSALDCLFISFASFSLGLYLAECKNLYIFWVLVFGGSYALQISFQPLAYLLILCMCLFWLECKLFNL